MNKTSCFKSPCLYHTFIFIWRDNNKNKKTSKINSAGDKCYRNTTNNIILNENNWKWGRRAANFGWVVTEGRGIQ